MKIVFVSYIYPHPERGYNPGIERVVQEFAKGLVRQGHEVRVLTTYRNGGKKEYEVDEGVQIHRIVDTRHYLGKFGSLFSLDLLSLNISIRGYRELLESADIVHAFTPIVHRFFSTPLVAHYHHWDNPSELLEYLYLPTSHSLWMRCYEIADRIIAVSEYSADDLSSRGADRAKISVVPNGVDTNRLHPGPSSISFEYDPALLYVGPLEERKGIKYLIKSMPQIVEEYPNAGLIIVGGGKKNDLENLTEQMDINHAVEFKGFIKEDVLADYYKSSDVFVFPSYLEGFGMVLIEAMACGLPVVSTTATAIPEVVGDAGILVPPKSVDPLSNAVLKVLEESSNSEVSETSLERVESNFSWTAACQKLLEAYSDV